MNAAAEEGPADGSGPADSGGPVRVFLAGYGTVGKALHRILEDEADAIAAQAGRSIRLVGIARNDRFMVDPDGVPLKEVRNRDWATGTVMEALGAVDADLFLEATPTDLETGQPALGHCKAAFREGMPVVLANKGPLVAAYDELMERAEAAGVAVRFEATVAGCIPTLSAVRESFAGDTVERVEGIFNGTTNFILTRMAEEGSDLDQALREAQSLGYAEADPTADLEGHDAAAKVVILANAVLGRTITLDDVAVQGIRDVTRESVELAKAHGYHVKLIAEVDRQGTARVGPRLVKQGSPLDVRGALNAVHFRTRLAGEVTHVGPGAGGKETAAAMLGDLVGLVRSGN